MSLMESRCGWQWGLTGESVDGAGNGERLE